MSKAILVAAVLFFCALAQAEPKAVQVPDPAPAPAEPRKIVYMCDASGSMQDVFSSLREEMKRSVNALKPSQLFNVIFYSAGKAIPFSKEGLLISKPDNKKKLAEFVDDVSPRGDSNPLEAIKAAFANKPESILWLTDGLGDVKAVNALHDEIAKLNKDQKVHVTIILLVTEEMRKDKELFKAIEGISHDNGGLLKMLDRDEFKPAK